MEDEAPLIGLCEVALQFLELSSINLTLCSRSLGWLNKNLPALGLPFLLMIY